MAHSGIPERETQTRLALVFLSVHPKGNLLSAFVFAFLSVIPEGNLLLPLPLFFFLSFPKGICFKKRPRAPQKGRKSVPFSPGILA